jgi:hypothetical protein
MAGHVARIGDMRNEYSILVGKPERKNHTEDLAVDGRIILEWIFVKYSGKVWTERIWHRIGTSGGYCEHGDEPQVP